MTFIQDTEILTKNLPKRGLAIGSHTVQVRAILVKFLKAIW